MINGRELKAWYAGLALPAAPLRYTVDEYRYQVQGRQRLCAGRAA